MVWLVFPSTPAPPLPARASPDKQGASAQSTLVAKMLAPPAPTSRPITGSRHAAPHDTNHSHHRPEQPSAHHKRYAPVDAPASSAHEYHAWSDSSALKDPSYAYHIHVA